MSRTEFNGLTVLWVLIVIVTILPATLSWLFPERATRFILPKGVEDTTAGANRRMLWKPAIPTRLKRPKAERFDFDPNTLDAAGWQRLGLSEKQAAAILTYRNKGGRFRTAEDVGKMYTINPNFYTRIAPFIHIAPMVREVKPYVQPPARVLRVIELNTADTLQLQEIVGIGPAYARRIFKYRERLGGFHHKMQLLEVYGLDSLKYAEIAGQLNVDASAVKKLMINHLVAGELKNHPYLNYKQINAIVQYRKQHGNYSNIADLNQVVLLSAETLAKLEPYISFEP